MVDFFFVGAEFVRLTLHGGDLLVEPDLVGSGRGCNALFEVSHCRAVTGLQFVDIIGADAGDGVPTVAVEVNQALEAVLLAAVEEPVDRAFLVDFAMVGKEIIDEIIADNLTRGFSR